MNEKQDVLRGGLCMVVLLAAFSLLAKSTVWSGAGDGLTWGQDANWNNGAPVAGDAVSVSPAVATTICIPEEGVSIASLTLGGIPTFTGGVMTVTLQANTSFKSTASTDVITFENKLSFAYPTTGRLTMPGTWYFRGGLVYNSYFTPDGKGTIYFEKVPVTFSRFTLQSGTVHVNVSSNALNRVQLTDNCQVHVNVEDPWLTADFDYFFIYPGAANAIVNLHGHDVYVPWLILSGKNTSKVTTDASSPATLTFDQKTADVRTNLNVDISGPLTLRMTSASDKGRPYVLDASITSTGGLVMEGGVFEFGANGTWADIAYLRLNGGRVSLPEGKVLTVPALYFDSSDVSQADGWYGSSQSGAQNVDDARFVGKGKVLVRKLEPATQALAWNALGGSGDTDLASSVNWVDAPAAIPLSSGALYATFAAGSCATHPSGTVAFKGCAFASPLDFTLSALGIALGSLGLDVATPAKGGGLVTIRSPVKLEYSQTWNLASATTVRVENVVWADSVDVDLAKTGPGALVLYGANAFGGDFSIDAGLVVTTNLNALGAGNETVRNTVTVRQKIGGAGLVLSGGTLAKNLFCEGSGAYDFVGNETGLWFQGTNTILGTYGGSGTSRPLMDPGSVLICEQGIASGYIAPEGNKDRQGPRPLIRLKGACGQCDLTTTRIDVSFEAQHNRNNRIELHTGTFHARVPYAWIRTDAYINLTGSESTIDLHGNDQVVGTLMLSGATKGTTCITSGAEGPATLYVTQQRKDYAARTNHWGDLSGQLSIVMGGPYASYHDFPLTTSGDLTVTNGTFAFLENGSWLNGTNFTVLGNSSSCKGTISLMSSKTFNRHSVLRVGGLGNFELAQGVAQICEKLYFEDSNGNWVLQGRGTYGSSSSDAHNRDDVHFAGKGKLRVVPQQNVIVIY